MPDQNEVQIEVVIPDGATPDEVAALEQAAIDKWMDDHDGGLGEALAGLK